MCVCVCEFAFKFCQNDKIAFKYLLKALKASQRQIMLSNIDYMYYMYKWICVANSSWKLKDDCYYEFLNRKTFPSFFLHSNEETLFNCKFNVFNDKTYLCKYMLLYYENVTNNLNNIYCILYTCGLYLLNYENDTQENTQTICHKMRVK